MIDTIVLLLTQDLFEIIDPDLFTPSAQWIKNNNYLLRGISSKQNPTKKELAQGIYKPRLTLFSFDKLRMSGHKSTSTPKTLLKIELSLPKLLFGNNFQELTHKQFHDLVQKL
jgi:hypothetical protein